MIFKHLNWLKNVSNFHKAAINTTQVLIFALNANKDFKLQLLESASRYCLTPTVIPIKMDDAQNAKTFSIWTLKRNAPQWVYFAKITIH